MHVTSQPTKIIEKKRIIPPIPKYAPQLEYLNKYNKIIYVQQTNRIYQKLPTDSNNEPGILELSGEISPHKRNQYLFEPTQNIPKSKK